MAWNILRRDNCFMNNKRRPQDGGWKEQTCSIERSILVVSLLMESDVDDASGRLIAPIFVGEKLESFRRWTRMFAKANRNASLKAKAMNSFARSFFRIFFFNAFSAQLFACLSGSLLSRREVKWETLIWSWYEFCRDWWKKLKSFWKSVATAHALSSSSRATC